MEADWNTPLGKILADACAPPHGMSFEAYMHACLYHPGHGFYAEGGARVGRSGDFFTSVSVGPCFGRLLADHLHDLWKKTGSPARWILLEQGADDGRLAADILASTQARHPDLLAALHVVLIEPFDQNRRRQEATLTPWNGRVSWVEALPDASTREACVFLANELLDALPVHRVRRRDGDWREVRVVKPPHRQPAWTTRQVEDPALQAALAQLPDHPYPEGYTTEVSTAIPVWIKALSTALPQARLLLIDYGHEAADYYHPSRSEGTLRAYQNHRVVDDPLRLPGACDLTAHVDLTSLTRGLAAAGWKVAPPIDQGRWLTRIAEPWLRSLDGHPPDPAATAQLRQFTTLTHPAQMGRQFLVVEAKPQSV